MINSLCIDKWNLKGDNEAIMHLIVRSFEQLFNINVQSDFSSIWMLLYS